MTIDQFATNAFDGSAFAGNFGSPTQLIIVLVIVLILFGGKRLRSLGSDLGNAIKGFKDSMSKTEAEKEEEAKQEAQKVLEQNPTAPTANNANATAEKTEHKQP